MRYLIGCDFGGGASKAILLREEGMVVAEAESEYATSYPRPGWAEQNPEDSFRAFVENIKKLFNSSEISPEQISAIALDGATHTAVLLDKEDKVIRPAIYWTDLRAVREAEELKESHLDKIVKLSANTPGALWTLPQLMWLRRNEPENFARIHKIMSIKDYVRYRLTGDYVTDSIEACGFMLYDVNGGKWSRELCSLAGVDPAIMPKVVPPEEILSSIKTEICRECGLSEKTKVIAGATDTVMEVYASGAIQPGQATVKLATAGRICAVTEKPLIDGNLVCYPHVCPGLWYPGTATKSCAASFRWYRDVFGAYEKEHYEDAYAKMAADAAQVRAGSDGLFFHPYLQGELTPYQDEMLKGSFTGIRAFHTRAHFNRAVLEGIAYSLKDCFYCFRELGADIKQAGIIGGGAKGELWRQIVADMLGIPLTKAERDDSSLGSAMLAGVACGVFENYEDSVARCVKAGSVTYPNPDCAAVYEEGFLRYKKLHDALAEVYHS
ncbi:xylulokinase [bacterium 1xD8-48]|nr:xylulokinase [bacterium 1xD8-48]